MDQSLHIAFAQMAMYMQPERLVHRVLSQVSGVLVGAAHGRMCRARFENEYCIVAHVPTERSEQTSHSYKVYLMRCTCSCGKWTLMDFP